LVAKDHIGEAISLALKSFLFLKEIVLCHYRKFKMIMPSMRE
jgi:hypothetical protein